MPIGEKKKEAQKAKGEGSPHDTEHKWN